MFIILDLITLMLIGVLTIELIKLRLNYSETEQELIILLNKNVSNAYLYFWFLRTLVNSFAENN